MIFPEKVLRVISVAMFSAQLFYGMGLGLVEKDYPRACFHLLLAVGLGQALAVMFAKDSRD